MIDSKALLEDLKAEVKNLEADLRPTGEADPKLKQEWQEAREADRIASPFETWLTDRVTQVAVAWILATVFVRFAEDNGLIEYPYLAGPNDESDERTAQARERQEQFFYDHPELTDRDWIKAAFDEMGKSPVAQSLFAEHNPMWSIQPSNDAAKTLIAFWRKTDASGAVNHDFTDKTWNTRFLGDLYQDLSEETRDTFALFQTPEFVEEFILKFTLDPAIDEFGLEPDPPYGHDDLPKRLRVIDPTCGSGHFLLGAFHRLLSAWQAHSPMTDKRQLVDNALSSVHGVDKNPYAVAIARFRLMLAVMREAGVTSLKEKIDFPLNIAVGDSLLHGKGAPGIQGEFEFDGRPGHAYRTEDVSEYIRSVKILEVGTYHAVVGNPPYVGAHDKKESDNYRRAYPSCYKEYSLSVPFAERFFKLAIIGASLGSVAGFTGQITANSFMKREFGQKLVKEFFPRVDLTHVIDTSGAYIPGHGTPTIILFGRRRYPRSPIVRTVQSVNGEPGIPENPSSGFVWTQIAEQVNNPGFSGEWVSVDDMERKRYFERHPWILESGGLELVECLGAVSPQALSGVICRIGYYGDSHADQVFLFPLNRRFAEISNELYGKKFHRGQQIRDWKEDASEFAILPYDEKKSPLSESALSSTFKQLFWPYRTELWNRVDFSGKTYLVAGRSWWEWHQLPRDLLGNSWVLAYSDISTHNHFVLNTSGDSYNRHAPIIRLKLNASEDDYLGLLALLNSSTACFWLKQVSPNKGNGGIGGGIGDEPWEPRYEFSGTKLEEYPLLSTLPLRLGRDLETLARKMAAKDPSAVAEIGVPTQQHLRNARVEYMALRGRMIALQEELDWDTYRRYGLLADAEAAELMADSDNVPELKLGERAFEIVLARRIERGEISTQWFARHGSTPITEIPMRWPEAYKRVVARRIEFIQHDRSIGLIERPERKRRWKVDPWEDKERVALTTWLLDRCEDRSLWYGPDGEPRPLTVNNLTDRLRKDADFVSVARLMAGADADLADVLGGILDVEHVPYLAQFRYKGEGLIKRTLWEQTWNQQRAEDETGKTLDIPVPPKYTNADFHKPSYWRHRGKLDVPKERFISYPAASPDGDGSLLLGWAGWDHREQAYALISLITQRSTTDGWATDRLIPLIAGLAEVMPWVRQWHNEVDPSFGQSPADAYDEFLTAQRLTHHLTDQDLASVKPPAATRRRTAGARGKARAPKSTGFGPVVAGDQ